MLGRLTHGTATPLTAPDAPLVARGGPGGSGFGIAYSPFRPGPSPGSTECKPRDQVEREINALDGKYSMIRLYGGECEQIATLLDIVRNKNFKLFLGIWNVDGNRGNEVRELIRQVGGRWDKIDTVSVGNEVINRGAASVGDVIGALRASRDELRRSGYNGPVVNVDVFVQVFSHPELCNESDYCAVNIHPYFDGNRRADEAGQFVADMVNVVRDHISDKGKRIVVTESGWPWAGNVNGAAVPGRGEQAAAIESLRNRFANNAHDLILFSAYDEEWKNPGPLNVEKYWGIKNHY